MNMSRYIVYLTMFFFSVMWGQDCVDGVEVELWGECYNIEETTELELSNSGLMGEIPPEIGDLINLTYLNLFSNELTGEIPVEIGNLTNLTILGLMDNQLTGEIPHEIGNLINLTYLNLYSNQLTGDIPPEIGNLTNLWYLELQMNQLTGQIPSEIGNLVNLTILHLNDNNLSGEIPENICDLTIDWSGVTEIHELPLPFFDVDNNNLCPPYPECIEDYIGFQYTLECGDLPICDEEIEVYLWGECYNIEETIVLNLSGSGLTGEIPPEIGNLTNLTYLNLFTNQLTGEIPSEIGNLTNLNYLNLSSNQLTGEIPEEICNQGVSSLFLSNNYLCPPYPECISQNNQESQDTSNCP